MVLYLCRECGEQISSSATRCPFCGAPPRPPLHGRPWSHRLALRAGLVLVLALPLLMLPLVLRWHNGSWDPCRWTPRDLASTGAPPAASEGATALAASSLVAEGMPSRAAVRGARSQARCFQVWVGFAPD